MGPLVGKWTFSTFAKPIIDGVCLFMLAPGIGACIFCMFAGNEPQPKLSLRHFIGQDPFEQTTIQLDRRTHLR